MIRFFVREQFVQDNCESDILCMLINIYMFIIVILCIKRYYTCRQAQLNGELNRDVSHNLPVPVFGEQSSSLSTKSMQALGLLAIN